MINIVLDLDDTLYLEQDYVLSGFLAIDEYLQNTLAISGFAALAWQKFMANKRAPLIDLTIEALGINVQVKEDLLQIYRHHKPNIQLQKDAAEFLQWAYPRYPLYLITDGRLSGQLAKIEALKIDSYFKKMIINSEEAFFKPNPFAFKAVMEDSMGGPWIYIADNPKKDFIAPEALNWLPSIRIRRPESLHASIPATQNVKQLLSLMEVVEVLKKMERL